MSGFTSDRLSIIRRDERFRHYWVASTISAFGDGVSSLAIPLTAVSILHASPFEMGFLAALAWLPSLILSVHAGVWVDRRGRRRQAMIVADCARFLLLASIPAAYLAKALTLPQVVIVTFGAGCFSALFNVSNTALFGTLVAPDDYVEAQAVLSGAQQVSTLAGPSAAGLMIQAISAPLAIFIDAASFLFSARLLSRLAIQEERPERSPPNAILLAGLRFTWNNRIIKSILSATMTINFFTTATQALFVLYVIQSLRLGSELIGLFYATSALGGIVGSWIANRVARRIGIGKALLAGCVLFCAPDILIPLARGPALPACALLLPQVLVTGIGLALENISIGTIFAIVVPASKRATVRGSFQAISFGVRPLGALIGGAAGSQFGIRSALWAAALGGALSFLWILFSPIPEFHAPAPSPDPADPRSPLQRRRTVGTTMGRSATTPSSRAVGCLVLPYGQNVTRVAALAITQVARHGSDVHIRLGKHHIPVPPALRTILLTFITGGKPHTGTGSPAPGKWLFPDCCQDSRSCPHASTPSAPSGPPLPISQHKSCRGPRHPPDHGSQLDTRRWIRLEPVRSPRHKASSAPVCDAHSQVRMHFVAPA